jgi:hypothetical protein
LAAKPLVAKPSNAEAPISRLSIPKSRSVLAVEPLVAKSLGALARGLGARSSSSRAAEPANRRKWINGSSSAGIAASAEAANRGERIHASAGGGTRDARSSASAWSTHRPRGARGWGACSCRPGARRGASRAASAATAATPAGALCKCDRGA